MAEEDKATSATCATLPASKMKLEIQFEGVKATMSAESSVAAGSSGASTARSPIGIGYGGGQGQWLLGNLEMKEVQQNGERMEETCIRSANVGKYIAEFKTQLTDNQIILFEWEATNEDQGRYDRNITIHFWLKANLNLFDTKRALAKVHRILARQPLLINGHTIPQSLH